MIRTITLAFLVLIIVGCQGVKTAAPALTGVHEGGDTVESTELTRSMIGKWGQDGEAGLIVTETDGQIRFSGAENDTWRMEISDAKILGDTVTFTQKHYLHDGTDHPFNGVACYSIAKKVDNDILELGITNDDSPEYDADLLERIK